MKRRREKRGGEREETHKKKWREKNCECMLLNIEIIVFCLKLI
jgi:hypothetical protein